MAPGTLPPYARRLARLQSEFEAAGIDALIVTNLTNIRYLTSFHGTAGALVVLRATAHLVVDFRYATAALTAATLADSQTSRVEVLVAEAVLDDTVAEVLGKSGTSRIGVEASWISLARYNRLAAAVAAATGPGSATAGPERTLITTDRMVEQARAVKDDTEVATLREAARRLTLVAEAVPPLVRTGRTEADVAVDIERLLREAGFSRPAFETIVASGPNGARPHARPTPRQLQENEGVVLDFGGVYDGYCVDLTRTVELGTPSPEWRRLQSAVAEAQAAAIAVIAPGVPGHRVDMAARTVLERHGLGEAFGHATGHGLGLDVHEEPRIARHTAGQAEVLLVPGMVFTVEPGAYVEGVGGVRIEDDVLVTSTGCEVLTRRTPPGSRTSLGG